MHCMIYSDIRKGLLLTCISLSLSLVLWSNIGQAKPEKTKLTPAEKAKFKAKVLVDRETEKLDLYWGTGAKDRLPTPDPVDGTYTFIKEEEGNQTFPKVIVKDSHGVKWKLKFGMPGDSKAQSETAATRLAYGCGIFSSREVYYVASGKLKNFKFAPKNPETGFISRLGKFQLQQDAKNPEIYNFSKVSFTRKEKNTDELDSDGWNFGDPSLPIRNDREFSALKIFTVLINNWDTKDSNVEVSYRKSGDAWYDLKDLGAAFGNFDTSGLRSLQKNYGQTRFNLKDYKNSRFISWPAGGPQEIKSEKISLHYMNHPGQLPANKVELRSVPVAHAKWYYETVLSKLTKAQVEGAFKAAGATQAEVKGFSQKFMEKVQELKMAIGD